MYFRHTNEVFVDGKSFYVSFHRCYLLLGDCFKWNNVTEYKLDRSPFNYEI